MDKLWKALIATVLLIILLIGLPVLIGLIGVLWPVLLIIAAFVFIPVLVGVGIGSNGSKKDKED